MATPKRLYVCQACGAAAPKWMGRCPECEQWGSLVEEAPRARAGRGAVAAAAAKVESLSAFEGGGEERFSSGLELVDRVLGSGLVPGSIVLVAGEPGIGKSTLGLQLAGSLCRSGRKALYVGAEESPAQLRLRARRLGVAEEGILVTGETDLEAILGAIETEGPDLALVDSVQAVATRELEGPPGSIGQVRAVGDRLVELAKRIGKAVVLIGHVTKEGTIAGPKSLEHLVDTVVTFEGDPHSEHRILRATKNRFGPAGELAMFEMGEGGLVEVRNPSKLLLERRRSGAVGSAVAVSLQGLRPLLVEVQSLTHGSQLPTPRRMSVGLDSNRVALLVAVVERFLEVSFAAQDLFLNVVGGLSLREPAADLAIVASMLSARSNRPLPEESAFFGEVGLLGEVRRVVHAEARLREAASLGFRKVFLPEGRGLPSGEELGLELEVVSDLQGLARKL